MAAALAVCGWGALQSTWESWRLLIGLIILGLLLFAIARIRSSRA
jgi:hypothetical protein